MTDAEGLVADLRQQSEVVVALATLLSPAVRVERTLLRRVRTLLPTADAGTEAELWFSDLVLARGTETVTLRPHVADYLRRCFGSCGSRHLRRQALDLIDDLHADLHWSIRTEERIIRLAMSGRTDADKEVEQLLAAVLVRLKEAPEPAPVARWLLGALARLPKALHSLPIVQAAALTAGVHLDGRLPVDLPDGEATPGGDSWLPWLFSGVRRTEVPVRLLADTLELGGVAGAGAKPIAVPRTTPLAVTVGLIREGTRTATAVQFKPDDTEPTRVPADAATVEIITLAGDRYTLRRPSADIIRKTCLVVMGFGLKPDFPTGRTLNLDKSYRVVIKPAVEQAGLECIRMDEMVGPIDTYRPLLEADVVVADISTMDPNALYELGARHGLRPFTTIVIAEDQTASPFDPGLVAIRRYQHLGVGIDAEEALRFRAELSEALRVLVDRPEVDSPVYALLPGLRPPSIDDISSTRRDQNGNSVETTFSQLKERAESAMREGDFAFAKGLLQDARRLTDEPSVVRSLAVATYRLGDLWGALEILRELSPDVTNDPETLAVWGSVHWRLWEAANERAHLDAALLAHGRSFSLQSNCQSGIELAFVLNARARVSEPAEAIADFVTAQRVRRRVIALGEALLSPRASSDRYRIMATLAEAHLGLGNPEESKAWVQRADEEAPEAWMRTATEARLAALENLLTPSPLDLIDASATTRAVV